MDSRSMRKNISVCTVADPHGRIRSSLRVGGIAVIGYCLIAGIVCPSQNDTQASLNEAKAMPAQSYLSNILEWALLQKVPVGLVVKEKGELCSPGKPMRFSDHISLENLAAAISAAKYESSTSDGVVQIIPLDLEKEEANILGTQIGTFRSIRTSMNSLGVILSGWLFAKRHPGVGYGGDLMTSDSSEMIAPFVMENARLVQVANHIVALDGKGLWILILYRGSNDSRQLTKDPEFKIYSYHDDVKAISRLQALVCGSNHE